MARSVQGKRVNSEGCLSRPRKCTGSAHGPAAYSDQFVEYSIHTGARRASGTRKVACAELKRVGVVPARALQPKDALSRRRAVDRSVPAQHEVVCPRAVRSSSGTRRALGTAGASERVSAQSARSEGSWVLQARSGNAEAVVTDFGEERASWLSGSKNSRCGAAAWWQTGEII